MAARRKSAVKHVPTKRSSRPKSAKPAESRPTAPDRPRPLLMNGEQYTVAVTRGSGGGEKYQPYSSSEAQAILLPQVTALRSDVREMDDLFRSESVVFEMKLLANYFGGSYFPKEVISRANLDVVGSRSTAGRWVSREGEEQRMTRTLLVAGADESIERLEALVGGTNEASQPRLWQSLVRLDTLGLSNPETVLRRAPKDAADGELLTWEAVLHPVPARTASGARRAHADILQKWEALVRELSGEIELDDERQVDGLSFFPVALTVDGARTAARFNPLRCLRPMAKVRPLNVPVRPRKLDFEAVPQPADATPRGDAKIAIFDGGVDPTCPFIAPFVTQYDRTTEPPDNADLDHGSAVTTTVLYGYIPADGIAPRPDLAVDHFRVLPLPPVPKTGSHASDVDRELYWLLDRIDDEVRAGDYTLVNLSVGPQLAVDEDGEPDRWTSTLDQLARVKNVLFVTAAGNDGDKAPDEGLHRVQVPADMVNGLGVGACTRREGEIARAPYSSMGPGRWGARIQPAGVAFGGVQPRDPFIALLAHGAVGHMEGTSFAAPLVTHGLAGLALNIGTTEATPDLLRAFAIHFAEPRRSRHDLNQYGYGRFRERYDDLWEGSSDEVTVVYRDALRRDGIAGYQLPLPLALHGKDSTVSIRWTVCVTAPVAAKEPADYTLAGFDVTFRPHARVYAFSDSATRRLVGKANIVTEAATIRKWIRAGAEQSKMPVSHTSKRIGRTEHGRRESGWWETAVQSRIARMSLADLYQPTVELKYVAREGGALQPDADVLPFTMVVTIRTAKPLNLYDETIREFSKLEVAGATLGVQTRVQT